MTNWYQENIKQPDLKRILEGNPDVLNDAFVWQDSPDGEEYWSDVWSILERGKALPDDARKKLTNAGGNIRAYVFDNGNRYEVEIEFSDDGDVIVVQQGQNVIYISEPLARRLFGDALIDSLWRPKDPMTS